MKHVAPVSITELDALYEAAVKAAGPHPNALGFLRRVPGSVQHRAPCRSHTGQPIDPGPSQGELNTAAGLYRLAARAGRW